MKTEAGMKSETVDVSFIISGIAILQELFVGLSTIEMFNYNLMIFVDNMDFITSNKAIL